MCGIVGYIGEKQAYPILIDALKRLEYRGYDSSGVSIIDQQKPEMVIRKSQGKIIHLEELIKSHPLPPSTIGICHTRWATHGMPNNVNAHPHKDCSGKIVVVHNGIIENYEELKNALLKKGHTFLSQTDTEVVAHLVEEHYQGDIFKAVQKTVKQLKGAFALGILCLDDPKTLIAARVGSPLIIGIGKNENFIASDVPAILQHTKKVIYLKEGELAKIQKDKVQIFDFNGKAVSFKVDKVTLKVDTVQKQGYPHFMLKEIHEQPHVLTQMFRHCLKPKAVSLDEIGLSDKQLKDMTQIFIVACGTAYHAGMVGKYLIELLAGIPVAIDVSSEFRYRTPIIGKKTLVLAISQSGETADTLAAIKEAKAKGAKIVSICNVVGSSLARISDGVLYTHAGPEIGVASTKAYTAQLGVLYLLAIKLGLAHKTLSPKNASLLMKDLKQIPSLYARILKDKHTIERIAEQNAHFGCFLFLGRNINYPSALEGALKLKEISYIPAEGYAAGEMKHGPIALIDEYRAVICLAPESDLYEKMISNIQEIRSRKGKVIALATEGDAIIHAHADHVIYVPKTNKLLTPLLMALPLQMIAYYIAVKRGCDVDQPRNLAKSVTVE
ncbi:MAG: glutamine--fructose-6-phosphate transaminase (isomerizing) [Candidatus Omnitrophica bacterium]|nr:glutamine--fructose-6-phosphate transaminase (isomerizing) [Candidatus Omnitrophota bacterium]